MSISHADFRHYNPLTDIQIKYQCKTLQNVYRFLKKEVYPYTYCYIYGEGKYFKTLGFATNKDDFMHMCGMKYKAKKNVPWKNEFLKHIENNELNYSKLMIHADGTTIEKVIVISMLPNLFKTLDITVSNEKQIKLSYNYDGYIATKKRIISLGLKSKGKNFFVPQTLLNLRKEKIQLHGDPVHAILRKNRKEKSQIDIVISDDTIELTNLEQYFEQQSQII